LIIESSSNGYGKFELVDGVITTPPLKKNNDVTINFGKENELEINYLPVLGNPERLVIGFHSYNVVSNSGD